MKYAIVTGTSRGLGEAIAKALIQQGVIVLSISRHRNERLEGIAKEAGVPFYPFSFDLQDITGIEEFMSELFDVLDLDSAQAISLINNAGMLDPMKPAERAEAADLIQNVHVNLLAPMLLTSQFLKRTSDAMLERRIINISSGAGKNPYFGWSAYCTTKAGIDMFTRCVALEEQKGEYPAKILSFAPGVVDTEMQSRIRSTSKEDFATVERFHTLKETGQLLAPDYVAQEIVRLLDAPDFEQGGILRVQEPK